MPQDVRERKGSFYTPPICVELSQKYLADVVDGHSPIGFLIWDLEKKKTIDFISVDVFDDDGNLIDKKKYLIDWFRQFINRNNNDLGSLRMQGNDIQQRNNISISSNPTKNE